MQIKKGLLLILGIFIFLLIILGIKFVEYHFWYSANVTDNYCIEQRFISGKYDLTDCSNESLVKNIDAWVIESEIIIGAFNGTKYFVLDRGTSKVNYYDSAFDLDEKLHSLNLGPYDMNKERNVSHLKN